MHSQYVFLNGEERVKWFLRCFLLPHYNVEDTILKNWIICMKKVHLHISEFTCYGKCHELEIIYFIVVLEILILLSYFYYQTLQTS